MSSCHEPLSSNAGKIVSVRFSEEDLAMLEKCRVVEVSTGVTVQLPKATLIRQFASKKTNCGSILWKSTLWDMSMQTI